MSDAARYYRTLEIPRGRIPEGGEKSLARDSEKINVPEMNENEMITQAKEKLRNQGKARYALERIRKITPADSPVHLYIEEARITLNKDQKKLNDFLKEKGVEAEEIARLNNEAEESEYRDSRSDNLERKDIHESEEKLRSIENQLGVKLPETRKKLEEQKEESERKKYLEKSDEVSGKETGPAEKGKAEESKRIVK
jgi:hypothetical protein